MSNNNDHLVKVMLLENNLGYNFPEDSSADFRKSYTPKRASQK